MTTIAYRDGVMAADSRAYRCSRLSLGSKTKIRRLSDGRLLGCSSGNIGVATAAMDWFAAGMIDGPASLASLLSLCQDGRRGFEMICVTPDGELTYIDANGLPTRSLAGWYAIGSGDEIAMGAMAAGKSAAESVIIACNLDALSAPPVHAATHDQDPKEYGPLREADPVSCRQGVATPLQDPPLAAVKGTATGASPYVPVPALPGARHPGDSR